MSFDDVARRMKERHADHGLSALDEEIKLPAPGTVDPIAMDSLREQRRARAVRQLVIGALLLGGGVIVSMLTRGQASHEHILTYMPISLGIFAMVRGIVTLAS